MSIHLYPHITADPSVEGGRPVIAGTDVPVSLLVQLVATGRSLADAASTTGVTIEDVRAALEFVAARADEPVTNTDKAVDTSGARPQASGLMQEEARKLGLDPAALSPLGRRLLEQRAKGLALGEKTLTTWEQLDAEIAERRGERQASGD